MSDVKHRIGLGTLGNVTVPGGTTAKNDITAKTGEPLTPPFTFDRTDIKMDSKIRTFDEII